MLLSNLMCCFGFNSHLIRDPNGNAENTVIAYYIFESVSYVDFNKKLYHQLDILPTKCESPRNKTTVMV